MKCNSEILSKYINGEISGQELYKLETHIKTCKNCQTELEELKKTILAIKTLQRTLAPDSILVNVRERIKEKQRFSITERLRRWLVFPIQSKFVPAIATVVVVLLVITYVKFEQQMDEQLVISNLSSIHSKKQITKERGSMVKAKGEQLDKIEFGAEIRKLAKVRDEKLGIPKSYSTTAPEKAQKLGILDEKAIRVDGVQRGSGIGGKVEEKVDEQQGPTIISVQVTDIKNSIKEIEQFAQKFIKVEAQRISKLAMTRSESKESSEKMRKKALKCEIELQKPGQETITIEIPENKYTELIAKLESIGKTSVEKPTLYFGKEEIVKAKKYSGKDIEEKYIKVMIIFSKTPQK